MSTTIGNLAVVLSANSSGFTAGLGMAASSLNSFVGMAKGAGAILGVTGLFSGITQAFSGFAEMESSQVAFETLLGSGERAKTLMADLQKFGAETPFQLPELTAAAKNLAAFGMGADEIVPKLRRIGDISSLLGQPIGEMATLYGKAKVAGVLMSEDINQFTERGVPLIQQLAKQFGVAEVQVKKLASEGKVSFADLDTALSALTDDGGRFAGGMEKQSKTLKGLWSTLTDNVGMSLTKIGEGVVNAFNVKGALSSLSSITDGIANWVAGLQPAMETAAGILGIFWDTAVDIFKTLGGYISTAFDFIGEVLYSFTGATLDDFVKGLQILALDTRFVFANMGEFVKLFAMKGALGLVSFVNDTIHWFTVTLPEVAAWFSRNWVEVFRDVFNWTTTVFSNLGSNIVNVFKNIPGLIAGTVEWAEVWTPLTEGFVPTIKEALNLTGRELTEWEKGMTAKIAEVQGGLANKRAQFIAEGMAKLQKAAQPGATLPEALKPKGPGEAGSTSPGMGSGKDSERKFSGAFEVGSREAYDLILKSRSAELAPVQRTAAATETIAKQGKEANDFLEVIEQHLDAQGTIGVGSLDGDFGGGSF